jgi:hypothetical protein
MRAVVAAILALYAGFFTILFGCLLFAIPTGLLFWGLETLPLGQTFAVVVQGLKHVIVMVLLIWIFVCFMLPAYVDTLKVAYRIVTGRQPPNPYLARDAVMARFVGLGRDIGRVKGLLRKVGRLFHA